MEPRRTYPEEFVEPCIPTLAAKPPCRPGWVHEIKRDGYRVIVRRDGKAVRPFTRRDLHWTDRYPERLAVSIESHHFSESDHIG
jgi:bifunctional non-homologous end joining protein LigD